jgi:hypothetical protein
MAWFKLDDTMWSHPKFLRLSDKAFRLWVRAGAYCAQHLTDGIVSDEALTILGATRKHCDELWAAGLWERIPEGGYRYHDWHHYQLAKEEVDRRREADRLRKKAWRDAKAARTATRAPLGDPPEEW